MTFAINPEDLYMEFTTKRKSGRTWIITPDGRDPVFEKVKIDNTILKALVKAHWQLELKRRKYTSIRALAAKKQVHESYARRIINLNYLSPRIKEMIIDGKFPRHTKIQDILYDTPIMWSEQEKFCR